MSAGAAISAAPGTTAAEVAAEGLLIGAPMALTLMAWGKTLGANPPRLAATEIFAATGIAAACCFALWFAPEEIGLALRCVLPFAGVAFMEIARHEQSGDTPETAQPPIIKPARARALSARMLTGALIFGLAAGFVEAYRSDPGSLSTPTLPYAMFIVALFCGGVLETLRASGERDTFSVSYRIAFTLMLAGFLFTQQNVRRGVDRGAAQREHLRLRAGGDDDNIGAGSFYGGFIGSCVEVYFNPKGF